MFTQMGFSLNKASPTFWKDKAVEGGWLLSL